MKKCIALIGFMGSGKSTVGRMLAARLGFDFADTDQLVESLVGLPVREIFRLKGEPFFRDMEGKVIADCFEAENRVLATGGGLWLNETNRERLLANAWCVWLKVTPQKSWERVRHNLAERPLLSAAPDPFRKVEELILAREPVYSLAPIQIDASGNGPEDVCRCLEQKLMEQRPFDLPTL
jgi:shikimate kinase